MNMHGLLYVIGVGPGDPGLLTIKAADILRQVNVIAGAKKGDGEGLAFQIAEKAVPDIASKEKLLLKIPMTKDSVALHEAHEKAAHLIESYIKRDKTVALLTLGDPVLYSTSSYIWDRIKDKGYKIEIISGVPALCAAAARITTALATGNETISISTPENTDFAHQETSIILKAGDKLGELKQKVKEAGKEAWLIENCGMPDEKVYAGIENIPDKAGYMSLLIVK